MRKFIILFFVLFLFKAKAQKYDYTWILGYPAISNLNGNTEIVFTLTSADTIGMQMGVSMQNSQTTISDSAGNLLFFTNGAKIYNRNDSIMLNGDSINYGAEWNVEDGLDYNTLEEIIGLPTDTPAIWNLIHYYLEYTAFQPPFLYAWRIDQSRVDMRGDTGLGAVAFKNKTLVQDTLGSYVNACKHANGRDWWVLASKTSSNCLYTLLVQPDTVIQYPIQCLGNNYTSEGAGQAAFSPDGTKFAWLTGYNGINIYDFDRCSGQLSNPVNLPFSIPADSGYEFGLSISPNSRFLYITQSMYVMQFDLQANDIAGSVDTVGYYKPPPDSNSLPGPFFLMQLAADGKIYVSANNAITYLHVINDPDKKGDSCNFVNYGFPLPYYNSFSLPSYPGNYRLGALTGSPCDTLTSTTQIATADNNEKILRVYPNPATDYTIVDYGFTNWSKGQPNLEICNALGQVIYERVLPMYSGFQKIDVSNFAGGIYTVFIKRQNAVVATCKLIKQ